MGIDATFKTRRGQFKARKPASTWQPAGSRAHLSAGRGRLRPRRLTLYLAAGDSLGRTGPIIGDNDPDHMEKIVKFNELLANCVIFHNAVELTSVLNELTATGHPVRAEDVATLSPYSTRHILRFGDYVLDLTPPRTAVNTHLVLDLDQQSR